MEAAVDTARTPPPLAAADPSAYLAADDVVQSDDAEIARLAGELRAGAPDDVAFTRSAYEWVRDQVTHSVDAQDPTVTVTATEVLAARTGLCYRERVAFIADPAAGEVDYPDIMARPAPPVLAALRGSDDVLELCRTGLPAALDSAGTEGGS
ncbi:hypothetical protein EAS64_32745 [Trebonia kvetii]|uniref:Uncharacterized protein n=1 Tax=Trebonia kvetii TaxID=2480626 RepID=A0A6P2BQR3_9ACTN|nr:hypothetical protein EAS64_32745 [Trebonia kvetii]